MVTVVIENAPGKQLLLRRAGGKRIICPAPLPIWAQAPFNYNLFVTKIM
jgi:hypothetical protein